MTRRSTTALTTLAALVGLGVLAGCAAHVPPGTRLSRSGAPTPTVPPEAATAARLRTAEKYEVGATSDRLAAEALDRFDASFQEGRAAWLIGDLDAAQAAFDRALDEILVLDVEIRDPELLARVESAMASIHELAMEESATDSPLDEDVEVARGPVGPSRAYEGDFTIPVVDHPAVDAMVNFYTGRAKDRLELGLRRYGRYAPTVARILEEEGVPPDLAWLALVESNYNAQAHSRARAKGLWQFISATGRRYGLKQDFWVDERADFEKATRSSARYMRDLYGMFGDWHLALAAYNAGEGRIGRAIKATGQKDFWHIRNTRHIRRETKDYVPAFLAVMKIVREPARYGITFAPAEAMQWELCEVDSCTDVAVLAECAGCAPELLHELNPELRRGTTPAGEGRYTLRVPAGARERFTEKYAQLPPDQRLKWQRHVVRKGDTLNGIAGSYGTSVSAIMAANGLRSANKISVGWSLVIPRAGTDGASVARFASMAADEDAPAATRRTKHTYRVRPGDTASKIARRHGTSLAKLCEWNGLRNNGNRIRVGQRLVVYTSGSSSSRVASAAAPVASSSGSSRVVHVVKSGDTLSEIAARYKVAISRLRSLNGLGSQSVIRPGQRLVVRAGSSAASSAPATSKKTHTVRAGDTLSKIASLYGTTVGHLVAVNGLSARSPIHPGDRIKVHAD